MTDQNSITLLLETWLDKFNLDRSLLAILAKDTTSRCLHSCLNKHEANTFVLRSAAFYQSYRRGSKVLFQEFKYDFGTYPEKLGWADKTFLRVLDNSLRHHGVYTGSEGTICDQLYLLAKRQEPLTWDEKDLQRTFKHFSPAFQEEIISEGLLPKNILSTLVSKEQELEDDPTPDSVNKANKNIQFKKEVEKRGDQIVPSDGLDHFLLFKFIKSWDKKDNYTGDLYDSLYYKVLLFEQKAEGAKIPTDQWSTCFKQILSGEAQRFILREFNYNCEYAKLIEALTEHFETLQKKQYLLDVWEQTVRYSKLDLQSLESLVKKLRTLQYALGGGHFATDTFIIDGLLRAYRGLPEFMQLYRDLPQNFEVIYTAFRQKLDPNVKTKYTESVISVDTLSSD